MRDIFEQAHAFTARWEGGYANHKNDPGGATSYGVSLRWLQALGYDVNGDGHVDIGDIRDMDEAVARDLFRIHFWEAAGCDVLPPLVAVVLYDGAVNMGAPRATRQLQDACNRFAGAWLQPDGRMGPRTVARARELCSGGVKAQLALCQSMIRERDEFYAELASRPPVQKSGIVVDYRPFYAGWINRTAALLGWVTQLAREGWA